MPTWIDYEVTRRATRFLAWTPLPLSAIYAWAMASGSIREHFAHYLSEFGPLEVGTFLLLIIGGILGIRVGWCGRGVSPRWHNLIFLAFGIGLTLVALEEIAWGQAFLGFASPEYFAVNNIQGETTLHNLPGIHGRFAFLYLAFCIGGILGAFGPFRIAGRQVVPPIAVPLLYVTLVMASYRVLPTIIEFDSDALEFGGKLPELVEFWIGLAGLITSAWNLKLVRSLATMVEGN
ncbi:MAG: hypothetical protein ACYTEP_09180 [Planctomycetota bacterium]|jgi:uncharacterized membrane protein YfcA